MSYGIKDKVWQTQVYEIGDWTKWLNVIRAKELREWRVNSGRLLRINIMIDGGEKEEECRV